jgi:hypothetical protein
MGLFTDDFSTTDERQAKQDKQLRKKHSHRCKRCGDAVYCYKTACTKPQRIDECSYCAHTPQPLRQTVTRNLY